MYYNFAILDLRPIPAAQAANDRIFSGAVFGIEVTVPALAIRCTLGNVDPQHGTHAQTYDNGSGYMEPDISSAKPDEAAIEFIARQPGHKPGHWVGSMIPPVGSTLATVRADLDSVGAMAILLIHAECCQNDRDTCNSVPGYEVVIRQATDRIRLVAESDKFARGRWPGPRPLPTEESLFDDSSASAESDSRLAPMAVAVSDFKIPLDQRVAWMKTWLLTGEEPAGYREKWLAERKAIAWAVSDGTIRASVAKLCSYCGYFSGVGHSGEQCPHCYCDGGLEAQPIAAVVSTHRAATSIGYSLAPIVVALNPEFRFGGGEPHAKFTVCQFTADYLSDVQGIVSELQRLEILSGLKSSGINPETGEPVYPSWGGSGTIIGSPQGVGSLLGIDQVIEVVAKYL